MRIHPSQLVLILWNQFYFLDFQIHLLIILFPNWASPENLGAPSLSWKNFFLSDREAVE